MRWKNLYWIAPAALAALISAPAIGQQRPDERDRREGNREYRHSTDLEVHIATVAPPRLRHERRPSRPDRDSVWVSGFWDWQGSRWEWVSGRWERPEIRNLRWIAPKYLRERDRYRYEPGHWSNQRVIEGEEYRQWRERRGHDHDGRRDEDRDRDHDHGER